MNAQNNITSVEELFEWKPAKVQSWLDSVWARRQGLPAAFNWLLLAQHAAQLARWNDDLDWARVSTRVYDWLHRVDLDGYDESSMTLRAYFINKHGAVIGDSLLDPGVILKWFYESLSIGFSEAEVDIETCNELIAKGKIQDPGVFQRCRNLRSIKNKLSIIALLVESKSIRPDEDLSRWLDIRTKLP